jgi:hypothetical protein
MVDQLDLDCWLRYCGMIQLNIGSLLKLSGKIKSFDIPNCNLKWEKEVNLWPLPIFNLFS